MLWLAAMRLIAISLFGLLLLIQYPLWLGKGGWLRAWELEKQVEVAQQKNEEAKARNAKLESEVSDLKQGTEAVEERARSELGMIKDDEIFIQVLDANSPLAANSSVANVAGTISALPATPAHSKPSKPNVSAAGRKIPRSADRP